MARSRTRALNANGGFNARASADRNGASIPAGANGSGSARRD
ncbi:hypothetical protein [Brevundimonas sp.]